MERTFARIISYIFHPLLIPSYAVFFLIILPDNNMSLPFQHALLLLAFIFLSTFVFPALLMLILTNFKIIASLEMETQKERVLPLIIMSIIFYAVYFLLKQGPQGNVFNLFMLGSTLLVLFSLLINYLTKISIHMVAQGGLFGAITAYSVRFSIDDQWIIILIIFIAGITAFSRLTLKAHTQAEVYGGFILGTAVMMGLFLLV